MKQEKKEKGKNRKGNELKKKKERTGKETN